MTAPSAAGHLAETPLAHALVYARNRRLSGRLDLQTDDGRRASITLWSGRITGVQNEPASLFPGTFFGAIVYELGYIDAPTLDATLLEIAKTKRLHGEVLIERSAITAAQRDEALVEQIHRKVHQLFAFPDTATYAFYDVKTGASEVAVDPVGPVWRGIREHPPTRFVEETMRRVADRALRVTSGGSARLPPAETALAEALAARPMTLAEMKAEAELPPAQVELLVYLLVIAKCVESVSGARTHPSTGALPTTMPSGTVLRPSPGIERPSSTTTVRVPADVLEAAKARSRTPPPGTLAALRGPAEYDDEALVARARAIEEEELFAVLGVAEGASVEAVRAAYVRLAKAWHPDRLPAAVRARQPEVAKIFSRMTHAHVTLCDPDRRRAYEASQRAAKAASIRPREEVVRAVAAAMARRDFAHAERLAHDLVSRSADDAEAVALEAWASVRGGEATEEELRAALAQMERAVNLDRTSEQAVYHRGLVHKRLGNVPAAFRDFARAVQLNPKHADAEREVRIFAMRARKVGSGEHAFAASLRDKLGKK
jgi:curved DNA-binding protein CbpA